jgi:hypothetical protein
MTVTPEGRSTKVVENPAEESPEREQGFEKECETKDDGRYIIFFAFDGEELEGDCSDREGVD